MFLGSLDYTISSCDYEHYNRIKCNLIAPLTSFASIVVTSLTCNCDLVILNPDDYIAIEVYDEEKKCWNEIIYKADDIYKATNENSALTLIHKILAYNPIVDEAEEEEPNDNPILPFAKVYKDNSGRLVLARADRYRIKQMSYNCTLLTGFYNTTFPVEAKQNDSEAGLYVITANSVGFNISTPILYLVSNIGMQSYRSNKNELRGARIVMRINNSFIVDCPIIVNNADFSTNVLSNDLAMLEFTLVDANMHEIQLLSPMYITIHIEAVKDEDIISHVLLSDEAQQELSKNNAEQNKQ